MHVVGWENSGTSDEEWRLPSYDLKILAAAETASAETASAETPASVGSPLPCAWPHGDTA